MPSAQIRVLCADDHPLILDGIARLLEREPDMILVAEASDGIEAVKAFQEHKPDVVLMDLLMPKLSGVAAITIRDVHSGQRHVPPEIACEMTKYYASDELSPREIEVLKTIAAGRSNKLVADRLQISQDTVKGHMRSILAKLNANDRLDAVLIAMRRGILDG
jgi:DNA-binding NarL/FixJ family response regulator